MSGTIHCSCRSSGTWNP